MPIETNNLVLYKSERLTDTSDGGGKYSGQVVTDGESNNLFPDVSELDRTVGRVSLRKIIAGLTNNDTESLMGSTVFISKNPEDPNVSALLFSTRSHTDTRDSAQNRLENYLAKGAQAVGSLLDTAYSGMKSFQAAMSKNEAENNVGDTIVLVINEGAINEFSQYVRITSVETRAAFIRVNNADIEYKIATYSFQNTLNRDFVGVSASQWYNNVKPATTLRDTIVADAGVYYASVELANDVAVGGFTVQAKSMFSQLIPSPQTETPLLDLNAVSENPALISGNSGTITTQFTTNVNNNQSLYIGSSMMPSSVSFTLFGQTITDNGGTLRTATGTQVGTIDYQTGRIVWINAIGSGNTTINITFTPAAAPVQPFESYALPITANNQGTNWTGVLVPIPAPGALSVSFMAQGKFYVLKDNGTGRLVGANESVGSGSINYTTGTWLLTTGALPDVGTPILLQWGSPITTFARANLSVLPAGLDFQLFHNGIKSLTATWLLDGVVKTAIVDSSGQFTGDAIGSMIFNTGKGRLIPKKLPPKNTVFTLTYDYGEGKSQTVSSIEPDSNQKLTFTIGTGSAIQPSSVGLDIPVTHPNGATGTISLHDVPVSGTTGNLVDQFGNVQGSIIYATGVCEVTPTLQKTSYSKAYTPTTYSAG
ncbi:MAG: tail fiber protein [Podoviridae sp. ctbh1]|nr:MAG: tail fiber protein [Podoviridae sp. ctbh1]